MKQFNLILLIFFAVVSFSTPANSQNDDQDIHISILTCGPGSSIYTLFGHTAIRVKIPKQHFDFVYNYGLFDFSSKNFAIRFALGHTDYQLGQVPYDYFIYEYNYFKRDVWEQKLNLPIKEKRDIVNALNQNLLPENVIYRYNFLYDNCATRPIAKIEDVTGKITMPDSLYKESLSYRDVIHKYSKLAPWSKFGMDLCLGADADKEISTRQLLFAPLELMKVLDLSTINGVKLTQPIAKVLDFPTPKNNLLNSIFSPTVVFSIFFLIIVLVSYWGYTLNRNFRLLDLFIFSTYGIVGLILTFLALFSEHPAVSNNYLLFIFHPIHLICAPIIYRKAKNSRIIYYHYINICILTLFILFYCWIPQRIDFGILPLGAIIWVRSLTYIIIRDKK